MVRAGFKSLLPKRCCRFERRTRRRFARRFCGSADVRNRRLSQITGRTVADVGQRLLPEIVVWLPFGGNAVVVALAGAVGAAEAVPVGGEGGACEDQQNGNAEEKTDLTQRRERKEDGNRIVASEDSFHAALYLNVFLCAFAPLRETNFAIVRCGTARSCDTALPGRCRAAWRLRARCRRCG